MFFRAIVINFVECFAFRANVLTYLRRGLIGLIRQIIRHYENDEDLGFGFDGGCDAAGGMPTGEGGTGEECAC